MRNSIRIVTVILTAALIQQPALAVPFGNRASALKEQSDLIEPVVFVQRGFVARGPRGGVVAGRAAVARSPYVRPVRPVVPVRPAWVRPPGYYWHPGMAVAAGVAIGAVSAAAARAWAGPPPAPGYCWYYTDQSKRQGFWDVCP
ncbi:hypothetical protein B6S44_03140 [Bosea sp. Tri-44]|uniref:hypothetical protein n=1 Tax=Bosea sp. Tri-44 TaxID=1972137 RepID=UPI00100DD5F8|nr:hypothetical protein [Bosea sp. Tri-44]RXT57431.1 hypothetical protein B6S44_03140 [Bosea sp. Tri-44]